METLHFVSIDSTNTYCLNHYQNLKNYTFVSADVQTAGKGRNQRQWKSENGANLLFSLFINDKSLMEKFKAISVVSALSVIKALKFCGIQNAMIKWPNDVYVEGKKITGILLQGISHEELDCIVVGIGINVNQTQFEGDYRRKPTSVALELGRGIPLDKFRKTVYRQLEKDMELLKNGYDFSDEVKEYDYLKGMSCWAELDGERKQITVQGINGEYELDVETEGTVRSVSSGEISFHAEEI